MRDKILFGIILAGMVFYFAIMPAILIHGILSGKLDIETMELSGYAEEEYRGMGGY